jgi:hypothetical protein
MAAQAAPAAPEAPKPATAAADAYFRADPVKLAELKSTKPWLQECVAHETASALGGWCQYATAPRTTPDPTPAPRS